MVKKERVDSLIVPCRAKSNGSLGRGPTGSRVSAHIAPSSDRLKVCLRMVNPAISRLGSGGMPGPSLWFHRQELPLDNSDAQFIADMIFSIRYGFQKGSIALNSKTAIDEGLNICVSTLEEFDKQFPK